MSEKDILMHYVCTLEEARKLVDSVDEFWLGNCGCRINRGDNCKRSRKDVCLQFYAETAAGSSFREVSRSAVEEILREAEDKYLVARPFRNMENPAETEGICFCCDDCCEYFLTPDEKCDKGILIEKTDFDVCNNCGDCVEVCYFDARKLENGELIVDEDNCYGCGLCVEICEEKCVEMIESSDKEMREN